MNDGSHILETDESITVYGKSFLIKDGINVMIDKRLILAQKKKLGKNNFIMVKDKLVI